MVNKTNSRDDNNKVVESKMSLLQEQIKALKNRNPKGKLSFIQIMLLLGLSLIVGGIALAFISIVLLIVAFLI